MLKHKCVCVVRVQMKRNYVFFKFSFRRINKQIIQNNVLYSSASPYRALFHIASFTLFAQTNDPNPMHSTVLVPVATIAVLNSFRAVSNTHVYVVIYVHKNVKQPQ